MKKSSIRPIRASRVYGYPRDFLVSQMEVFDPPINTMHWQPAINTAVNTINIYSWGFRRTTQLEFEPLSKVAGIQYTKPSNDNFLWKNPSYDYHADL